MNGRDKIGPKGKMAILIDTVTPHWQVPTCREQALQN